MYGLYANGDFRAPVVRIRYAVLLAAVSGLLGMFAFPRTGWWPLAMVSVAGVSVACAGRSVRGGALVGLSYGFAFFVPLLRWTGIYVGPAPWLILAVAEAVYISLLGAGLALVLRWLRWPWAMLASAALWVLQEFVRDRWPFGGFPWARLAFSQADSPYRWFAAVGGAPLVSFAVALTGTALAAAALQSWPRPTTRPVVIGVGVAVTLGLVAVLLPNLGLRPRTATEQHAVIAVIQGSTPDRGLEFNARRRQVLDNHVQQTLDLAADVNAGRVTKPEMVLWPENSSDIDPLQNPDAAAQIQKAADAIGVPILVGAILDGPGDEHISNVGMLWFPSSGYSISGPGPYYTKRHPVPFAEYIPLRAIARIVSKDVDLVPKDMIAGKGNGLLAAGPIKIGDVICFEVAYDSLVRSSVQAGAQLVVVQTNNATFGHTAETYQQLAMSQLRAVETGRTVVAASTTGVSAIMTRDGVVRQRSGALFEPARLVASVALTTKATIATQIGPVPEYVLSALAVIAIALATLSRRRSRPPRSKAIVGAERASIGAGAVHGRTFPRRAVPVATGDSIGDAARE